MTIRFRPGSRALGALVLGAWLTVIGARSALAGPIALPGGLRLLTYNTAFMTVRLTGVVGDIDTNDGVWGPYDYQQRATRIAEGILRDDADIVALNEVFSDVAKEELVKRLSARYPNYIKRIQGPLVVPVQGLEPVVHGFLLGLFPFADWIIGEPLPNDSGLMLFSRYPFVAFPPGAAPHYDVDRVEGVNWPGVPWGGNASEISVETYDFALDMDMLASKAVAMVRVATPIGIVNVGFSHMQADTETDEFSIVRVAQFRQIQELVTDSLNPNDFVTQPVFLMGDLNVPGKNRSLAPNPAPDTSEWATTFDAPNAIKPFYACGDGPCTFRKDTNPDGSLFVDSWGRETSPRDAGETNYFDHARLDYVLHSKPVEPTICMQHVKVAWDLGEDDGWTRYSDHMGVRADFNRPIPHCSPNDFAGVFGPLPIAWASPVSGPQDIFQNGDLKFGGSMQWYRIDQAGTYSLGISDDHFGFEIYQGKDLSRPITPWDEHPQVLLEFPAVKYVLPEPPYYIRVFGRDPATGKPDLVQKGPYQIQFHQHRGLTPEDALGLFPGVIAEYPWPAAVFPPKQRVWFEFSTDVASSGKFPQVSFALGNTPGFGSASFDMRLVRDQAPTYPTISTQTKPITGLDDDLGFTYENWPQKEMFAPNLPGTSTGPKRYFVTLQRKAGLVNQMLTTALQFRTTLSYFRTKQIKVEEEYTWGLPADDVTAQWAFDQTGPVGCNVAPCVYRELNDGEFWMPVPSQFDGSFVSTMAPSLWDEFMEADETYLAPQYYWKDPASSMVIPRMARSQPGVQNGTFVWSDSDNIYDKDAAGYWYEMEYSMAHDLRCFPKP